MYISQGTALDALDLSGTYFDDEINQQSGLISDGSRYEREPAQGAA